MTNEELLEHINKRFDTLDQGQVQTNMAVAQIKTALKVWNDPYREVTTTTLDKVAKALGVPVIDLLEQVPDDET